MFPNGFPTRRSNSWIGNRRHGSSRFSTPLRPSPSASTKRVCSTTTGNIFYYREDGAWNFALIDVNRMAFRRNLSRRDCVEMLRHLDWETPYLDYVLIRYAELRRWDWKLLSGAVLLKQGINLPVRIRRFFKRLIGRK